MNWELIFSLHWPHDRCAIGWEYIGPSEEENITTLTIYLFIVTASINVFER